MQEPALLLQYLVRVKASCPRASEGYIQLNKTLTFQNVRFLSLLAMDVNSDPSHSRTIDLVFSSSSGPGVTMALIAG